MSGGASPAALRVFQILSKSRTIAATCDRSPSRRKMFMAGCHAGGTGGEALQRWWKDSVYEQPTIETNELERLPCARLDPVCSAGMIRCRSPSRGYMGCHGLSRAMLPAVRQCVQPCTEVSLQVPNRNCGSFKVLGGEEYRPKNIAAPRAPARGSSRRE